LLLSGMTGCTERMTTCAKNNEEKPLQRGKGKGTSCPTSLTERKRGPPGHSEREKNGEVGEKGVEGPVVSEIVGK